MKRLSIIAATVMALVCCLCISVSAANEMTVSVKTPASVSTGAEVAVSVDFSDNDGFNTLGVKLTYPEGFTYVSADASDLIKEEFYLNFAGYEGETYVFYHDAAARTVTFVGASLYDIENASGSLFSAKFKAPTAVSTGNVFKVEVVDSVYNATGEIVTLTPENGSMDVIEQTIIMGDIFVDGVVDFIDAQMALEVYLGLIPYESLSENQKIAGDVVGNDGVIDFIDAAAILEVYLGLITL